MATKPVNLPDNDEGLRRRVPLMPTRKERPNGMERRYRDRELKMDSLFAPWIVKAEQVSHPNFLPFGHT